MNNKRNSGATTLLIMIACTRAAIETNEFMSLLTSLEGRRRSGHTTGHESGMGRPRSWVQCECTNRGELHQAYSGTVWETFQLCCSSAGSW
jgi:hypothetical protein